MCDLGLFFLKLVHFGQGSGKDQPWVSILAKPNSGGLKRLYFIDGRSICYTHIKNSELREIIF